MLGVCYNTVANRLYDGSFFYKNTSVAYILYSKSEKYGNNEAANKLGLIFYEGIHVPQNYKFAYAYYKRAAMQGNLDAFYSIGMLYENGNGVGKNIHTAYNIYNDCAHMGHALSMYAISKALYHGIILDKDIETAYFWSILSAMRANTDAINFRDMIAEQLGFHQIAKVQEMAIQWKADSIQPDKIKQKLTAEQ